LGGELTVQTVEGSPIEAQCPAAMKHQMLRATLIKDGLLLMGSDIAAGISKNFLSSLFKPSLHEY